MLNAKEFYRFALAFSIAEDLDIEVGCNANCIIASKDGRIIESFNNSDEFVGYMLALRNHGVYKE